MLYFKTISYNDGSCSYIVNKYYIIGSLPSCYVLVHTKLNVASRINMNYVYILTSYAEEFLINLLNSSYLS